MTAARRFMLPLAFATSLAAAPTQAAPDARANNPTASTGKAADSTARTSNRSPRRRAAEAREERLQTVRFPNCFFVFCQGQPLLIGVAF
jgi:hypothetical protein